MAQAKNTPSFFDAKVQRGLIERAQEECDHLKARLHAGASEQGHIHLLMSWKHNRSWLSMRTRMKSVLTQYLNTFFKGVSFSRGASRKRVLNEGHFNYLIQTYLPNHRGWGWYEDRGWCAPKK